MGMAIENVSVNMAIQKMTFETNDDLWALWTALLAAGGWVGGVVNKLGVDGQTSTDCSLSASHTDGSKLLVDLHVTVVAVVLGTYTAMTEAEYQSRYGTSGGGS